MNGTASASDDKSWISSYTRLDSTQISKPGRVVRGPIGVIGGA